jgi:hypothetical protein
MDMQRVERKRSYSEDDPDKNTTAVSTENSKRRKVDLSLDDKTLLLSLREKVSSRVSKSTPPGKSDNSLNEYCLRMAFKGRQAPRIMEHHAEVLQWGEGT